MKSSLIQGLKEKDMQAVVNSYNLNEFYFPSLFPLKFSPNLTWKTLEGDEGAAVAADVVSYDATAPRKTRKVVAKMQGDIPKIDIARDKSERDLNEYYQLLNYAKTSDGAKALVDFIYDDVEFCFKGVNARLEWLALRALSTGKIVLDSSNNNGIVTEQAIDFQVPTANKSGVSVIWSTAATAKPFTNIRAKVKAAKAAGIRLNYALMDQDTFDYMVATTEVQQQAAAWAVAAAGLEMAPDLNNVNSFMKRNNLPEIKIIDSYITLESQDGSKVVVSPWQAGVVALVPSLVAGNTYHAPLADEQVEGSVAVKAKRGHVLIKKFSVEEPLKETTKGMANAFPALAISQKMYLMDALQTTWTH